MKSPVKGASINCGPSGETGIGGDGKAGDAFTKTVQEKFRKALELKRLTVKKNPT